jgi:hypothetical protein
MLVKKSPSKFEVMCEVNCITVLKIYLFPPASNWCSAFRYNFSSTCLDYGKQSKRNRYVPHSNEPYTTGSFLNRERISIRLRNRRRSQWPRDLRRRSAAKRLLGSWVRIPPWAVCLVQCLCCQVEVSATGRSFVQRSPTDCGVCA